MNTDTGLAKISNRQKRLLTVHNYNAFRLSVNKQKLSKYNKANLKTGNFLPHIVNLVARAKNLDWTKNDYQTIVGSHFDKVIEKLK